LHAQLARARDALGIGSSHPLAVGRLSTAYPNIIRRRSLIDRQGDVVQPYGGYSHKSDATPLTSRNYQIEFWPPSVIVLSAGRLGNRGRGGAEDPRRRGSCCRWRPRIEARPTPFKDQRTGNQNMRNWVREART
jgi:hypothetical protein